MLVSSTYGLRSNDKLLLKPPATLGERAFTTATPKSWYTLPQQLNKFILTITSSKIALKTFFLNVYFTIFYCFEVHLKMITESALCYNVVLLLLLF